MLSAWTCSGHLLLPPVDDSSGAPRMSSESGFETVWNLTRCCGVSYAVNRKSSAWGSIEKLFKNNVLRDCLHVMLRLRVSELGGSGRHYAKGL